MDAVSPNFTPEVKFNGRAIPSEKIDLSFTSFGGFDTLPAVSPNTEVNLEVRYKDLNEKENKATSKVKLPAEPSASVKITGDVIRVAWGKPDKKSVSFVYVSINAYCSDGSSSVSNSVDTIITDIENVTEFSKTKGTMCSDTINPTYIYARGDVAYFYGPWSGSKDNIKGIKGQYYGATGVGDTTIWVISSTLRFEKREIPINERIKRMIDRVNKSFPIYDEGSWINGF